MQFHINDLDSSVQIKGSIAIDTEAMGLNIRKDRLCLVQLSTREGDVHIVQMQKDMYHKADNLRKILEDESIIKIFHFARFDVAALNYHLKTRVKNIYCTKIASKMARTYTERHGLKNLCKEILEVDLSKQEQSSDWGKDSLSPEQLKYAANDVIHLHNLMDKLNEMLVREDRMTLTARCFEAVDLICALDLAGIENSELFQH